MRELHRTANCEAVLTTRRYYDDEGWWALAWIAAYDLTGNAQYLAEAKTIFADMRSVFGKTPCSTNAGGTGGIWWDRAHTYVNAIANELFLSVAAHLATRTHGTEAAGSRHRLRTV